MNERAQKIDRFYEEEFPLYVKKYHDEFEALYKKRYNCMGLVIVDGVQLNLFEYIENYIKTNYNVPYSIRKDFDFHNPSIFYASTKDFGFKFNANGRDNIPSELNNLYHIKIGRIYEYGLFSHCFLGLTGLSKTLNEKVKENIEVEFELIKLRLRSYLKRFFLHGGVDWKWIVLDQIYHYGVDRFPNCLDHEFNQLEYSITFFERFGHLGEKSGKPYAQHEAYTKEGQFYSELKKKKKSEYTYIDVLKEKLIFNYSHKENKLYSKCRDLGDIPILILKNRPSLLGENGAYEEPYFNYLKFGLNSSIEEMYPYQFPINFKLNICDIIEDDSIIHDYLSTYNEPENGLRELFGLPKIGEGWISETNLYYEIKSHLTDELVIQHARPKWLGKQHLDIYIPKYNIGIEYQGDQHFYPIEYFGGEASFLKSQERDNRKREICEQNSCLLLYVNPGYVKLEVLEKIDWHILKIKDQK